MITITADAIDKVERYIAHAREPMDWFLCISWKWGAADNRRDNSGAVVWERMSEEGWVVDVAGWKPNKVPPNEGQLLFGDIRVLIEEVAAPEKFPGGEIYVEENQLKVKVHAV